MSGSTAQQVKAILVALVAAVLAESSTMSLALWIRRSAAGVSHQQPTPDRWSDSMLQPSPERVADGRKLFLHNCAHCHGADARGDEGPDLHGVQVSDRYISSLIIRGMPHEMPAFGKKLTRPEVDLLTGYVRSLGNGG